MSEPLSVPTLSVSLVTTPIPLSSVILLSLDSHAYDVAVEDTKRMEESVATGCGVLREGETIRIESGELLGKGRALRWKVAMTEPVLQGVVQRGFTRFLVLPPVAQDSVYEELEDSKGEEDVVSEPEDSTPVDADLIEDFDIDESFLAASVLAPPRQSRSSLPSTPSSAPPPVDSTAPHSAIAPHSATAPAATKHLLVSARPLLHSLPSSTLIPRPLDDEDEISRIYIKTQDLSKLGIFSGDWVVIESEGRNEDRRLVRCFASDGLVHELPVDGSVFFFRNPDWC